MTEPTISRRLKRLPYLLHVVQFLPDADLPAWVGEPGHFASITRLEDETSVITSHPAAIEHDAVAGPYVCFGVDEHLDFVLTGVVATLLQPLEDLHISTLVMSTYNTDWILVPSEEADDAVRSWQRHGHTVIAV